MSSQYLFTYGTLKSDQPEHAAHCVPPLSIQPAKAAGVLWRLREGYPILQIEPTLSLLDATEDPIADWKRARAEAAIQQAPSLPHTRWIDGELFEYPLEPHLLRRMDDWEDFVPRRKGAYQRRVIWVKDDAGCECIAWAYVCYSPPDCAALLPQGQWTRDLGF